MFLALIRNLWANLIGISPVAYFIFAAVVVRVILISFQFKPKAGLRIMDVAAFMYFTAFVFWVAVTHTESLADRLGLEPSQAKPAALLLAIAYYACLVRLFLLEWFLGEDENRARRDILHKANMVVRTSDHLLRGLVWFLLLSFPVYLGGHEIPWPQLFSRLQGVNPTFGLLLLNSFHFLWTLLLFVASRRDQDEVFAWHWVSLAGWLVLVNGFVCLIWSYPASQLWGVNKPAIMGALYTILGIVSLIVFVSDFLYSRYFTVIFDDVARGRNRGRDVARWIKRNIFRVEVE